jgi:dipeptidyl aminopeptidase/acylaminoacyl peptidase
MRKALVTLALCGGAVSVLFAQQPAARRFTLDDSSRVVRVAEPQISPDGRSIAVVISRANLDENRYEGDLTIVDIASSASRTFVTGRVGLTSPRWSPDGQHVAFLASAPTGSTPRSQLFVVAAQSGTARALTTAARGVQQFAWSPDGQTIAYATADEPEKKTGWERFNDSFEILSGDFLQTSAPTPTHLWLVPFAGGEAKRLTSGTWSLPISHPPGPPASLIAWTPDGAGIAFARQPRASGRGSEGIFVVTLADGSTKGTNLRGTHPVYSPDGASVAILSGGVSVAPAAGGTVRQLTQAIDRNIARGLWMPDSKSLIVGGNDNVRVSLWQQPVEGGAARKLDLGDVSPASSFFVDMHVGRTGGLALSGSTPNRPAELYYLATPAGPVKRLTNVNAATAALSLGKAEAFEWKSDQHTPNGILTHPPDFDPSKKYPLVLLIHGGPRAASLLNFNMRAQLMAAKGWLVFEPNYRGSDNMGNAFSRAIGNDAGAGPGRDVWAGMDAIKKRGIVDEDRVGVSGWSYGGFMTVWMIGHYSGWRAAVAGAAVTDQVDQQFLSDGAGGGGRGGNAPWSNPQTMERLLSQSPIASVDKIKTPTLILANTGDYRVPITESYKLFYALRGQGVETSFVAYPIYGHNATDPVRQRDVSRRWIEWLDKHFSGNAAPAR